MPRRWLFTLVSLQRKTRSATKEKRKANNVINLRFLHESYVTYADIGNEMATIIGAVLLDSGSLERVRTTLGTPSIPRKELLQASKISLTALQTTPKI